MRKIIKQSHDNITKLFISIIYQNVVYHPPSNMVTYFKQRPHHKQLITLMNDGWGVLWAIERIRPKNDSISMIEMTTPYPTSWMEWQSISDLSPQTSLELICSWVTWSNIKQSAFLKSATQFLVRKSKPRCYNREYNTWRITTWRIPSLLTVWG